MTDKDYETFQRNFPNPLRAIDWQEIIEALLLDSDLRGVHADKAMICALVQGGLRREACEPLMRGLVSFAHDAGKEGMSAAIHSIVTRAYAEHGK